METYEIFRVILQYEILWLMSHYNYSIKYYECYEFVEIVKIWEK